MRADNLDFIEAVQRLAGEAEEAVLLIAGRVLTLPP